MTVQYLDGAEPLYIKGTNTGCLLLHGAGGGTAWDLKEFAIKLNEQMGTTIWLPTLTGFGTRPEDLYGVKFDDWLFDARKGLKKLQEECERIFIVGHSMGGLLTLVLASEFEDISAIVTWAAPIGIKNRLLALLPIIMKIPIIRRMIPGKFPSPAPEKLKKQGWVGYDWIPTSIGFAIVDGLKILKHSLQKISCPAFIIQGTNDEMVSKNSPKKIYDSINSDIKEIWLVENATHPIMNEEPYNEELFTRTITFLDKIES
jgi:carboxylesterase